MERKFKKDGGITLIALIITIIIMLILVAVSVNILIKSNLIGAAEKTANGYKTAYEKENEGGVVINGKKYASVEDYVKGKEYIGSNIAGGTRVTKNTEYTIEGETRTAEIPAGFTVSGIDSERTIANGLVIYDIPEEDLKDSTTVDWENPDTVKTKYNQFVWIPVEVTKDDDETSVAAFARSEWTDSADGGQRTNTISDSYTEPHSDYDGEDGTGIASQIAELTKSIYNYGGFWIGRYEAGVKPEADGTETPRTSGSSQTAEFVIQQDKYPYNWIIWGTSMGDVSTEGAVYLCNNLYTDYETYGVKSMLCTGAAWDSIMDFIKDANHSVTDSTTWGNHCNSETYQITRGSLYSSSTWTAANTTGSDVTKSESILLTTGATERNSWRNLYDVAGNCHEWTTESIFMDLGGDIGCIIGRVLRGDYFYTYNSGIAASYREGNFPREILQRQFVPPPTLHQCKLKRKKLCELYKFMS